LIEVMIVIGIVGILASIAIPSFLGFQRRAKLSEVKIIVPAVFRDITQTFVQTSRWPWGTGPGATPWNPPLPPGGVYTKEKWVTNDPVWSQVTFSTEQPVWCRYMAHSGSPDYVIYIDVQCDLDADGDVCHYSEGFNTPARRQRPREDSGRSLSAGTRAANSARSTRRQVGPETRCRNRQE
jgi:type II secretory pathway pseudopilin PulG